ncbi:long-chain-fatty-acid--CoA ligase [Falsiroseomonas selenitidurans]|uniref:Long-chain-fatty-acid--CoA ligase n=1 Tax=Falsiroseomonas selenitidurans TaxID=2716335 RepID=A0ABX1E1J5_9PROT|nr:long-chain-fatty-acid--CoA ligase [Falsiroseomonas selenitidurans]NKC31036.1 long-chain-fatty-acid--CoA ligase [Falsiroseomonas selenitidurans]
MLGLMQDWPLRIHRLIDHAARHHGGRTVASRSVEGPIHRTDYATLRRRSLALAQRLAREGVRPGDRVATLAWNTWRHIEAWYGITGAGAVYHTLNPRLFPDQIAWILNHAESRLMLLDLSFIALAEGIATKLPHITRYVVLTDAAHMPETSLPGAVDYESWLAEADGDFAWLPGEENAAAGLCYTSGTTGEPKGVLYSHRSNVLHALAVAAPDMMGLSAMDRVMPVVPMFHANGWCLPFVAPLTGAGLVLPGPKLDGASLQSLMEAEGVSFTAAVPTVWLGLLQHLEATGGELSTLKRVVIGGSACPRALTAAFERRGIHVVHAWGMTETSPIGTICGVKPEVAGRDAEGVLDLQETQGFPPFTVDMRIVGDDGVEKPWDGATFGNLQVRGPTVTRGYFRAGREALTPDGWFETGDVATIDAAGYMHVTDRTKDVIKSGGEWISSIELENLAMGHPDVAEAAVVAARHPKWDERPLLVLVPKAGREIAKQAVLDHIAPHVAKWWLPDDVVVVAEIPHTATGKILKTRLREQFAGYFGVP